MTATIDEGRPVPNMPDPIPPDPELRHHSRRQRGRTVPSDDVGEAHLLGAALISDDAAIVVAGLDADVVFHRPSHAVIAHAIRELVEAGELVEPATVRVVLAQRGDLEAAGGEIALVALQVDAPTTGAAATIAGSLVEIAARRQLLYHATEVAEAVYAGGDPAEHIARLGELLEAAPAGDAVKQAAEARGYVGAAAATYAATLERKVRDLHAADDARRLARIGDADTVEWPDLGRVFDPDFLAVQPTSLRRVDGKHLIYPAAFHLVYGPPGCGKSNVSLWWSLELMRAGKHVHFLDWEGHPDAVGGQLRNMGATREQLTGLFHYARLSAVTATFAEDIAAEEGAGVVIDGVAKSLAACGWDEDRAADYLAWHVLLVEPLLAAGKAVIANDHVTKSPDSRDWARGTGAKQGEVSGAAYEVRKGTPYNQRQAGHVVLVQRKDRHGQVGADGSPVADIHFTPRGGGALEVEVRVPAGVAGMAADGRHKEKVWEAVSSIVKAGMSSAPSTSMVRDMVGGTKQRVADTLADLADSGHLTRDKGPRNADLWLPAVPYRAPADEPPPSF